MLENHMVICDEETYWELFGVYDDIPGFEEDEQC